jgi:hypothetical protein
MSLVNTHEKFTQKSMERERVRHRGGYRDQFSIEFHADLVGSRDRVDGVANQCDDECHIHRVGDREKDYNPMCFS